MLRQVCGENVIVGEGLDAINFGKMLALNETAAWLWQQAQAMGEFTIEALADKLCNEYEVSSTRQAPRRCSHHCMNGKTSASWNKFV